MADRDEDALLRQLLDAADQERKAAKKQQASDLRKAEKRKQQVAKLYEDWSSQQITEYNFNLLSSKYQEEQVELDATIETLTAEVNAAKQTTTDAEKWVTLIRQHGSMPELTAPLLHTLIEKITVHDAVKGQDGIKTQEVKIYYKFVGKIE